MNDKNKNNSLPDVLRILPDKTSYLVLLIRILLGSVSIKHSISEKKFVPECTYSINADGSTFIKRLKDFKMTTGGGDDSNWENALKKIQWRNAGFYSTLCQELAAFYYFNFIKSYTTSFVFSYRILEKISYSFPMIYSRKTDDYLSTFDTLKKYLKSNEDGELRFFNNFLKCIFEHDPANDIGLDIFIDNNLQEERRVRIYKSFEEICKNSDIKILEDSTCPDKITIKFIDYASFIITARNRFFHNNNSGVKNFQLIQIGDPDMYFNQITATFPYWINIIILEIIKNDFSCVI